MKRLWAIVTLFASTGTLLCCALPALFVALGAGSVFAALISRVPQLIWLSEHKGLLFGVAACLLLMGAVLQVRGKSQACPTDPALAEACKKTRQWTGPTFWVALGLFVIGSFFAFAPGLLGWT